MSTSGGKIQGSGGGDKSGDAGPCLVMAATDPHGPHGHGHSHSHAIPIDLASHHRAGNIVTIGATPPPPSSTLSSTTTLQQGPGSGNSVVQIRPTRIYTTVNSSVTGGTGTTTVTPMTSTVEGGATPGGTIMSGKLIGVGGLGSYSHGHGSAAVTVTSVTGVNPSTTTTAPPGSIISLNRSGQNLTILPARLGQTGVATVTGSSPGISTLQFARGTILGNVRAAGTPGQPASITVTPINPANFGTSIRLAGTVNNGSWVQTTSPQGFNPIIRPATIQVGGRTVRPVDGKVIHIPQHGVQHHVAQIQMVDNKGSIIKPSSISTTPIVRGTLHPAGTATTGAALTLPFTLRASIPTLHRPQTTSSPSTTQVQKLITQPSHGPPIQLVAAPKISQLQTITPIPRLNPVCLTISTPGNANQSANNTTPIVEMAPRTGPTNLIMTPSLVSASNSGTGSSVTKVYPISRELNVNPVLDMVNHGVAVGVASSAPSSTGVTFSLSSGPGSMPPGHILKAHSLPSGTSAMQLQVSQGNHHLVQVQGPLGVQSGVGSGTVLTTINPASGLPITPQSVAVTNVVGTPSYFMDHKNLNVSVLHSQGSIHPIALDKRHLGVSLATSFSGSDNKGSLMSLGTPTMILTSAQPQPPSTSMTTSLGPIQSHSFAHPVLPVGSTASGSIHTTFNHHFMSTTSTSGTNLTSLTPQVSIFSAPVSSKQNAAGQHPVTITMSGPGGQTSYSAHLGQGIPPNNSSNSGNSNLLPAHLISSKPIIGQGPITSLNSASILSATLNNGPTAASGNGSNASVGVLATSNPNPTPTTNSISTTVGATATTTTATTSTSSATLTTTSVSAPAQSPSQSQSTKSTLSPRPSILRKREAAGVDGHNVPLRAQRNLALNFGPNTSISGVTNSLSGSSSGGASIGSGITPISSSSASASAAVAANKENNSNTGSLGLGPIGGSGGGQSNTSTSTNYSSSTGGNLSILKKEFQPPNEESSWQSCSSNSSSGSTTLSTTSETAEIQLQQLQQLHQPVPVPELNLTLGGSSLASLPGSSSSSNQPLTNFSSVPMGHSSAISRLIPDTNLNGPSSISTTAMTNQNGIGGGGSRPNISSGPRVRTASSSKGLNKDIERLKGKSKDDYVSPRKKPRKQQLTTSDLLESASPEISFYQGKKFKKSELMDPKMFEGFSEKSKELPDASPSEHIVYYIKKPHVSLLNDSYAARPITNHFFKYSDVKAKEERRPTINDLANQKNVSQKVTGWKLSHLMHQIDQVVGLEMNVVSNFNHLLNMMDAKVGPNCASRDLNRIQELLKGNIQRCKVIRDQMSESRSQVGKIVEHRSRVQDVINKFASKRPSKKRERP